MFKVINCCVRYTQKKTRCKNPAADGKLCKIHKDINRTTLFSELLIHARRIPPMKIKILNKSQDATEKEHPIVPFTEKEHPIVPSTKEPKEPKEIYKSVIRELQDTVTERDHVFIDKLRELSAIPQPVQRSPEWFLMRKGMITASELASCIVYTEYLRDQAERGVFYVPDKVKLGAVGCNPYETNKKYIERKAGVDSPPFTGNVFTEWGKCYEPVATSVYSFIKDTTVHEYGLIPHRDYPFLGASPDGISTDGVMLEVKCPYTNRKIGIPVIYYWAQMQLQMEVAGIPTCDFFDCRIREFQAQDSPPRDYEYIGVVLEMTHTTESETSDKRFTYYYPVMFQGGALVPMFDQDADIDRFVLSQDPGRILDFAFARIILKKRYYYVEDYTVTRIQRDRYWFNVFAIPQIEKTYAEITKLANDPKRIARIESLAEARSNKRRENAELRMQSCPQISDYNKAEKAEKTGNPLFQMDRDTKVVFDKMLIIDSDDDH